MDIPAPDLPDLDRLARLVVYVQRANVRRSEQPTLSHPVERASLSRVRVATRPHDAVALDDDLDGGLGRHLGADPASVVDGRCGRACRRTAPGHARCRVVATTCILSRGGARFEEPTNGPTTANTRSAGTSNRDPQGVGFVREYPWMKRLDWGPDLSGLFHGNRARPPAVPAGAPTLGGGSVGPRCASP
jgi:hypothetical protein